MDLYLYLYLHLYLCVTVSRSSRKLKPVDLCQSVSQSRKLNLCNGPIGAGTCWSLDSVGGKGGRSVSPGNSTCVTDRPVVESFFSFHLSCAEFPLGTLGAELPLVALDGRICASRAFG